MMFQTHLNIKKKPSAIRSSFSIASHQTATYNPQSHGTKGSLNNKWFKFNVAEGPAQDERKDEGAYGPDDARSEPAINMTLQNYFANKMVAGDASHQRARKTASGAKVFKISSAGAGNVLGATHES